MKLYRQKVEVPLISKIYLLTIIKSSLCSLKKFSIDGIDYQLFKVVYKYYKSINTH